MERPPEIAGQRSAARVRLSIVAPMYNEESVVDAFFERLTPILNDITPDYEIICVDDGSADATVERLCAFRDADARVKILCLSRNFGKEAALTAGLDHAAGDAIIPIDADLQDPPEIIPELVSKWREGFDMVLAVRSDRQSDSAAKRVTANMFYRLMGRIGDVRIPDNVGDFRLMDRRVVEALDRLPERSRFMKGLFAWLGFKQATVAYARPVREAGESKFNFWKLWNFALDGVFSFSTAPLRVWTYFGVLVAAVAIAYAIFITVRTITMGVDVPGYASVFVATLFIGGVNMVGIGIIGEYLGRVFLEVKRRPIYLVDEMIGFENGSSLSTRPEASTMAGGAAARRDDAAF